MTGIETIPEGAGPVVVLIDGSGFGVALVLLFALYTLAMMLRGARR